MKHQLPLLLALLMSGWVHAAAQPAPPPGEARQFDFWIGEWEVTAPNGQAAGRSRIEKIAGGWGLLENWTGAGGGEGKSLNTWIPGRKQWQQFWVGAGGALELAGGLNAQGEMVLGGQHKDGQDRLVSERITWSPNADGSVRQHWEQSADGGKTWQTVFDGLYRRRK